MHTGNHVINEHDKQQRQGSDSFASGFCTVAQGLSTNYLQMWQLSTLFWEVHVGKKLFIALVIFCIRQSGNFMPINHSSENGAKVCVPL